MTPGHGRREGLTPRAHSTYLLGNYLHRFNVHELLSSCSDMWRSKVNVSLSFLPPGFPSTRCPVYVGRSVHGDQTIICSTLCSITSEVMTCTGGAVHFRSVIAKLGPQNSFRGVFFYYYTRHFSCCLGVVGWMGGGSCYTEKPVNQTHPSGG